MAYDWNSESGGAPSAPKKSGVYDWSAATGPSEEDAAVLYLRDKRAKIVKRELEAYQKMRDSGQMKMTDREITDAANRGADSAMAGSGLPTAEELQRYELDRAAREDISSRSDKPYWVLNPAAIDRVGTRVVNTVAQGQANFLDFATGPVQAAAGGDGDFFSDTASRPLESMEQQADYAAAESSGLAENLSTAPGYIADPNFALPFAAGKRLLNAANAARGANAARSTRAALTTEIIAGAPADAFAAGQRSDFDVDEMKLEVGMGAGGAVGFSLLGRGIGAAWKKFFPDEALPKSAAEAEKRLVAADPNWREKYEQSIFGQNEAALKDVQEAVGAEARAEDILPTRGPGQRMEAPAVEAKAKPGIERFKEREAARNAKLQADIDAPQIKKDADARDTVQRLEGENRGGKVLDFEAEQARIREDVRTESLKDPEVFEEVVELENLGIPRAEAEALVLYGDAPAPRAEPGQAVDIPKNATPQQVAMIQLNSGVPLDQMVGEAVRLGKWAKPHAIAAARWVSDAAGDAIGSMRDFARVALEKFGRPIRKYIPEIWQRFKQMRSRRSELHARTRARRSRGAIDTRSSQPDPDKGVPKSKAGAIRSSERAKMREAQRVAGAAVDDIKKQAIKDVKDAFPYKTPHRGKFLNDIRLAKSEADLSRVRKRVARVSAEVAEKNDIKETIGIIKSSMSGKVKSGAPVSYVFKNKDWAGRVQEVRALGVSNPAKPTHAEIASLSVEARHEIAEAYKSLAADFASERSSLNIARQAIPASREIAAEIMSSSRKDLKTKPGTNSAPRSGGAKSFIAEASLQPEKLIRRAGESAAKHIYRPISDAKDRFFGRYFGFRDEFEAELAKVGIDRSDRKWIDSVSGTRAEDVTIPTSGGDIEIKKGNFLELIGLISDEQAFGRLLKGKPVALRSDPTRPIAMSPDDLDAVWGMASKEDLALVNAAKAVMNRGGDDSMKSLLNQTSRRMTGKDLTSSNDYYPQSVKGKYNSTVGDLESIMLADPNNAKAAIENASLAKSRTGDTESPFLVGDLLSTVDRHFMQASALIEMADPARKVKAIVNSGEFEQAAGRKIGAQYKPAIDRWLKDVVEDAALFGEEPPALYSFANKWIHRATVGALGGYSPFVALKQTPSYLAAGTEMPEKYLAAGLRDVGNVFSAKGREGRRDLYSRMMKSGTMRARYEVHATRLVGEMSSSPDLLSRNRGVWEKTLALITASDKQVLMSIWRGKEIQVAKEMPHLKGDDFYKEVAEQTRKVARRTQPNFDMVDASMIQRGGKKNPFLKSLSMFMSQRNTNINMIWGAIKSGDKKKLLKVLAYVGVAQGAMISAIDEFRDTLYGRQDDEDMRSLASSIAWDTASNNASQVYLVGGLGQYVIGSAENVLRDKNSFVYKPNTPVGGMAISVADGASKFLRNIADEDGDPDKAIQGVEKMLLNGLSLSGVPVRTPYRMGERMIEALSGGEAGVVDARPEGPGREGRPTRPARP